MIPIEPSDIFFAWAK